MVKRAITILALAVVGLSSASMPVSAHHGTAAFDNKKVTMKGTVTEWMWSNPHCLLLFDAKGDDGQVTRWIGETQNPITMINGGWSKAAMKPGDEVTVVLDPVKNGRPLGRIVTVTLPERQNAGRLSGGHQALDSAA